MLKGTSGKDHAHEQAELMLKGMSGKDHARKPEKLMLKKTSGQHTSWPENVDNVQYVFI